MENNTVNINMHEKPIKTNIFLHPLIRVGATFALLHSKNKVIKENFKKIKGGCLILSNHMSFEDVKFLYKIIWPRRSYFLVSVDEFMGKEKLLRQIGCIPKKVHYTDMGIVRNVVRLLKQGNLVSIYPEATYSFAGITNEYDKDLGKLAKMAKVPVVVIHLYGDYLYSPRWNTLPKNKEVPLIAKAKMVVTKDEVESLSAENIQARIEEYFAYDEYKYQRDNNIHIHNKTMAKNIDRILYRCPHCLKENTIIGENNTIFCTNCKASYDIDELSILKNNNGETKFESISDWFKWQKQVELDNFDNYDITFPVKISRYINSDDGFDHDYGIGIARQNKDGLVVDGTINKTREPFHFDYNSKLNSLIHLTYDVKGCQEPGVEVHTDTDSYLFYPTDGTSIIKIRFGVEIAHQKYVESLKNTLSK